ncbi:MAG: LysR substrate-binding domain-containing protein [Reyranellaceae bacterium]
MRLDIVDLRLALHVVEAGSITGGAARAGLALASASERLRGLETDLGVALFERRRRGVAATAAGEALLRHARLVLGQVSALREELRQHARGLRGEVRLLSNTAATLEILPARLGPFLAAHPEIDVALEERPSPEIVRAVAAGRADLGIVADAVDTAAELETLPFAVDRLVLVVPRRHALARRRHLAFREALDADFVGLPPGSALQAHLDDQAARLGGRLRLRVRLPGFDALCQAVAGGLGVAVVSQSAAERGRRSLPIAVVPLSDAWAVRRLRICLRHRAALSGPARALLEHLAAPDG